MMNKILIFLLLAIQSPLIFPQLSIEQYLWEYPLQESLELSPDLQEKLQHEMQKIIDTEDLFFRPLPCLYSDQIFEHYFLYQEPGRILQSVAMAYPYLTEEQQDALRNMVAGLLDNPVHTPWAPAPLPRDAGKTRTLYEPEEVWGMESDFGLFRPAIQNIYSLWLYLYRTEDTLTIQPHYNTIRSFYNNKVNMGVDPGNHYGTMGAHVGMARLAHAFDDTEQIQFASGRMLHYLTNGLDIHYADSMAFYGLQGWNAPYAEMYENRKDHWVYRGFIFLNLSPEIGRYIRDHLFDDVAERHLWGMNRFPLWWLTQSTYFTRWTGDEGIGIPSEAFGMFVPVERWVMQQDAETLASYMLSSPTGIADSYWLEALVMALEAQAEDYWVDVRNTPFAIDIADDPPPETDSISIASEEDIIISDTQCFFTTGSIYVAGGNFVFAVVEGGEAILAAGQRISLRQGSVVESGGFLHAYINNNDPCGRPFAQEEEPRGQEMVNVFDIPLKDTDGLSFRLFPNPTAGRFSLEVNKKQGDCCLFVEIFSQVGKLILNRELSADISHTFYLEGYPKGIYLVRIIYGNDTATKRLILR